MPLRLTLPDGERVCGRFPASEHLAVHLNVLYHPSLEVDGWIEIAHGPRVPVPKKDGGTKLEWFPRNKRRHPDDWIRADQLPDALDDMIARIGRYVGRREDVSCNMLPRTAAKEPNRRHVGPGRWAWAEFDAGEHWRLWQHPHPAHHIVASGSGGLHAYWQLDRNYDPEQIETANLRLTQQLAADFQACDRARVLRMPGTMNNKVGRPAYVLASDLQRAPYSLDRLVGHLPDPPEEVAITPQARKRRLEEARRRREQRLATGVITGPDPAHDIAASEYFERLGLEVDLRGYALCPAHDDSSPSCYCWDEAERGFHCFGCGWPGKYRADVYTAAAAIRFGWFGGLTGEQFKEVKALVYDLFGLGDPARTRRR